MFNGKPAAKLNQLLLKRSLSNVYHQESIDGADFKQIKHEIGTTLDAKPMCYAIGEVRTNDK